MGSASRQARCGPFWQKDWASHSRVSPDFAPASANLFPLVIFGHVRHRYHRLGLDSSQSAGEGLSSRLQITLKVARTSVPSMNAGGVGVRPWVAHANRGGT